MAESVSNQMHFKHYEFMAFNVATENKIAKYCK